MATEKRVRAVGIPRQGADIRQESHFSRECYKSRSPADKCRNLLNSFSVFRHLGRRHSTTGGPMQTDNVSDTYLLPAAFAVSAVAIRRAMIETNSK